jgi:hypothetical protein
VLHRGPGPPGGSAQGGAAQLVVQVVQDALHAIMVHVGCGARSCRRRIAAGATVVGAIVAGGRREARRRRCHFRCGKHRRGSKGSMTAHGQNPAPMVDDRLPVSCREVHRTSRSSTCGILGRNASTPRVARFVHELYNRLSFDARVKCKRAPQHDSTTGPRTTAPSPWRRVGASVRGERGVARSVALRLPPIRSL